MINQIRYFILYAPLFLLVACEDRRSAGEKFTQDTLTPFLTILFFGWIIWHFATRKSRAAARERKELQRIADEEAALQHAAELRQNQAAAEAQRVAAEARRQQEKAFTDEQSRLDDEALTGRLRATVNELIDLANILTPGADNGEIVRSMHGTINELAKRQRELKAHHFDDDMLQHDITLILRRLEQAGLKDDLVVERLRKAMRLDATPASTPIVKSASPGAPSEPLDKFERLYGTSANGEMS